MWLAEVTYHYWENNLKDGLLLVNNTVIYFPKVEYLNSKHFYLQIPNILYFNYLFVGWAVDHFMDIANNCSVIVFFRLEEEKTITARLAVTWAAGLPPHPPAGATWSAGQDDGLTSSTCPDAACKL